MSDEPQRISNIAADVVRLWRPDKAPEQANCAVATGSIPGLSAAVFKELMRLADEYEAKGCERTADAIRVVAEEYRRHSEAKKLRQPESNNRHEPRA